jgi:shikimate dehydrogenase
MPRPGRLILLGRPVSQSLSPLFQNAALQAAGLAVRYEALEVRDDALDATLDALVTDGAAGNVTIPHKERVATRCDVLTPLAARLGAVNTWWVESGRLHGDNTDVGGFDDAAVALMGELPHGMKITVLGAGGSARAVVAAIAGWPDCEVSIWARTPASAESLVDLGPTGHTRVEGVMTQAVRGAGLVVNATPIGMRDEQVPVDPGLLREGAACLDLVYRRRGVPPFVQRARAQGRRADDGLQMLIAQGARSWERWFGDVVPDREVMWRAVSRERDTAPDR